jgi:glycosyltransferase involved in cell wall biosynthesis
MTNEVKFSVVIPTRNRDASLRNLLNKIIEQTSQPDEIIIVDSSEISQSSYEIINKSIKYLHTTEKSAARQRNIGIISVKQDIQVLFFLDDDTNPNSTYFEDMLGTLISLQAVGVSGLAINTEKIERIKPLGVLGFIKKISFLDSNIDGKLLISGVGIPVRKRNVGIIEVDWLIGCSCWDFGKIKDLKFEEDFMGYSLGEDVIFSVKARKLGKLFVNSNIFLNHLELPQTDLNIIKHNYMWVYYRFRLSKYNSNKFVFYLAFYLSVLSKLIFSLINMPRRPIMSIKQISGLTLGIINIFRDIFK